MFKEKWSFLILVLFLVLVWGAYVWEDNSHYSYAQVSPNIEVVYVYNSSGVALKEHKVLQWDTTWNKLTSSRSLDTLHPVYQMADTSGGFDSTWSGWQPVTDSHIKGLLKDTLHVKAGKTFLLKFYPLTAPTTDSVIVYGWRTTEPEFDWNDSTAVTDTIAWATTQNMQYSKYIWDSIDSLRMKTAGTGLDCLQVFYRPYVQVKMADSLDPNVAGVLIGSDRSGYSDSITTGGYGYMAVRGNVDVYFDGDDNSIEPGDLLTADAGGMVRKLVTPKSDTIRTSAWRNARYIKDAMPWDLVQITEMRNFPITNASNDGIDSVNWGAVPVTDSIIVIFHTPFADTLHGIGYTNLLGGDKAELVDTLMYTWIPRGFRQELINRVIGTALEFCNTDSSLRRMRLHLR